MKRFFLSFALLMITVWGSAEYVKAQDGLDKSSRQLLSESEDTSEASLACTAADCYMNYLLCKAKWDNDSAAYWLEKRAELSPDSIRYQLEAAEFIRDSLANYPLAINYYDKGLQLAKEQHGESSEDVAAIYYNIGSAYSYMSDYEKALENLERVLKIGLELFGENNPDIAQTYTSFGYVYYNLGDYDKSVESFEKALKIKLELFGENNPDVAQAYTNLGYLYTNLSNYEKSLENFEKALKIELELHGENHQCVAEAYDRIGNMYFNIGDYARAVYNLEKALKIELEIYGENHPEAPFWYNSLYTALYRLQQTDESKKEAFDRFMADKVLIGVVSGDDTPAAGLGLEGEYVIFKFGDWVYDADKCLYDVLEGVADKPKDIVIYRDGDILQHHFESQVGMQFGLKVVAPEKKKHIEEAFKQWSAK